jgi:protein involved in polysaccharide export with SLBB domain
VQALALAGGFTTTASLDSVLLVRRTGDTLVARRLPLDESIFLGGERAPVHVQPDDVIYVPRSQLATAAQVARELADLILFRGWQLSVRVDPW